MINSTSATSVAAAAAKNGKTSSAPDDIGLFAQELKSRFSDLKTRADKIQASLSTLKDFFPKANFTVADETESGSKNYDRVTSDNEVKISANVLENMTADTTLATQIQQMMEGFLGGGWDKNLIGSKEFEGQVWKSLNVQVDYVGYYESYQTEDGATTVAISNLRMEFDYRVSKNLESLLSSASSRSQQSSGNSSSALQGWNFEELANSFGSSSWQFSGFFSMSATSMFGSSSGNDLISSGIQTSKTITAILEIQMQMEIQMNPTAGLFGLFGLVDPLVLDLGGEGFNISAAEDGVYFDMYGNGDKVKTGFIQGNDALLYLDKNGNGLADDINELFGDTDGYANGFEKLRALDSNGDGVIDENDDAYADLRVWRDFNGDGVNQMNESMSLKEAGVTSIDLNYLLGQRNDGKGNIIAETSAFTRADGSTGAIADVLFRHLM
jgi:hypothetical protein